MGFISDYGRLPYKTKTVFSAGHCKIIFHNINTIAVVLSERATMLIKTTLWRSNFLYSHCKKKASGWLAGWLAG
jgi:hypothetical protein